MHLAVLMLCLVLSGVVLPGRVLPGRVLPGLLGGTGAASAAGLVDTTTLRGKLIMGYQGWFACPGDRLGQGWIHWSAGDLTRGAPPTVEMLPDVGELAPGERCPTGLVAADGQKVAVFSSQDPATVDRHFAWMQSYGLDGVALQRFATQLLRPGPPVAVDTVLANVRAAAERHGRAFFVMYDLSGMPPAELSRVVRDWARLQAQGVTRSAAYLRHRGHPVLGLWGLGFAHRPITPADATALLAALQNVPEGVTVLGGVPAGWRTANGDADPDPGWAGVWARLGVISPWTVGRYADAAGADAYRATGLVPDLAAARRLGADYMPVVFPGFSWANLMRARQQPARALRNQIPRHCGRFYWRQVSNAVDAGTDMLYGAMFDEVDEGTAMFKTVAAAADAPRQGGNQGGNQGGTQGGTQGGNQAGIPLAPVPTAGAAFLTLDADGCRLPSDWYLRLAGAATAAVRRGRMPPAEPAFPAEVR
jgi:hypothetical protein